MDLKGKLIAHRGYYHGNIPENSLTAFKKCLYFSIPIELDVHLTKDHELVVFHDHSLKRMTGKDGIIEEYTLKELQQITLKNSNESIPTLDQVLQIVKNKVPIIIELKNKKIGPLENKLISLLDHYDNFYIQSFKARSLYYLKRKRPLYRVGIILFHYRILFYQKFDFINCISLSISSSKIQKLREKKPVFIWKIDTKKELEKLKKYGDAYLVDMKKFI